MNEGHKKFFYENCILKKKIKFNKTKVWILGKYQKKIQHQ